MGGLGLLTLVAGCSSKDFYHEASPIFNLMPRVLQPGGHRDYVEKREREERNGYGSEKNVQGATWSTIQNLDTGKIIQCQGRSCWTDYTDHENMSEKGYEVIEVEKGVVERILWLEKVFDEEYNCWAYEVHKKNQKEEGK